MSLIPRQPQSHYRWLFAGAALLPLSALAQSPATQPATQSVNRQHVAASAPSAPDEQPTVGNATPPPGSTQLAPITVTAERREQSIQDVPASITALDAATIGDAQIQDVKQASRYAPNLYISQFSAPRTSFPFIRGIGSGQNSPAVATYIDGVPQLSFSTSNIQFADIDRIQFLRGPQSTLYGRNSLGGVITIDSIQPDNTWHGDLDATGGTYSLQDYRGGVRGPLLADKAYVAVAGGYTSHDGFSKNLFNGDQLDNRNDLFGRIEFRFTPDERWDLRITANGEHDRDGDFPLADYHSLTAHPRSVDHDYIGFAHRDVDQIAFSAIYHGQSADFISVSAVQRWDSKEQTDLDETPFDAARRFNNEKQTNYIEEVRLLSPTDRPLRLADNVKASWLVGSLLFVTNDKQNLDNQERPLATGFPVPINSLSDATLDTYGIGVYGQGSLTFFDKLDLIGGARVDYEHNSAQLDNFNPNSAFNLGRNDVQVSPQGSIDYHWTPQLMQYATVTRGFKAGGFNATAPSASLVSFRPEQSWCYETGAKSSWLDDALLFNADFFYIDWKHQQLDVPTGQPSQFYIDNVGRSHSIGFEAEGNYQLCRFFDVFGGVGFANARFDHYTQTNGVSAHGNRLPNSPETTWNVGAQATAPLPRGLRLYARAELIGFGPMAYDPSNAVEEHSYMLTNFRVGIAADHWRLEGFVNNAFNTHYIPIAYPFPNGASGYVGQSGDPLTAGVTLGVMF